MAKETYVWMCACGGSTGNGRELSQAKAQAALEKHWRTPTHIGKMRGTVRKK